MKDLCRLAVLLSAALVLAGCVLVPVEPPHGNSCPPGQAKKGNCYPEGGFCPPGHAKKGEC